MSSPSDIMAGDQSPLFSAIKFRQIVRLWLTMSIVIYRSNQDDTGARVVLQVLVEVGQVVEVGEQEGRVCVQDGHIPGLDEVDGNVLWRGVLGPPPALVDLEAADGDTCRRDQKPFHETTTATDARNLAKVCLVPAFQLFE